MKLIIDGNNMAYRAQHSKTLTMKNGEDVSAIHGTLQMLQSYLKKSGNGWKNKILTEVQEQQKDRTLEFSELIVCWDGGKSKWRKAIYPEYKGHRAKKREENTQEEKEKYLGMLKQMDQLHDILPNFGVKSLKVSGWEADDLIYATNLHYKDDVTVIVSTDRDMLQLVDDKTFIWTPYKEQLITPDNFTQLNGVPKRFYLTYRILVGDKSDNIDGIYGIGDKKAKDLIIKYGDIESIQNNGQALMKSVVTKRILENPDIIKRNEELMDMSKIPLSGNDVVEDITEYVETTLNTDVKFESGIVKMFLMSKQFVSILKDFGTWTLPFENLK